MASQSSKGHQQGVKRAAVILNFTALSKMPTSLKDHTPTPTRFIRNCEELGLFQDLQNVNPFEEGFQKALNRTCFDKLPTEDKSLNDNDDTLHTPKILPHIVNVGSIKEHTELSNEDANINESFSDDEFELHIEECAEDKPDDECANTANENSVTSENICSPLTKDKMEQICEIIGVPKDFYMKSLSNNIQKSPCNSPCNSQDQFETVRKKKNDYAARRRASNRRAQTKSRLRQKAAMSRTLMQLQELRKENERLKRSNKHLQRDIRIMQTNILLGKYNGKECEKSLPEIHNATLNASHNASLLTLNNLPNSLNNLPKNVNKLPNHFKTLPNLIDVDKLPNTSNNLPNNLNPIPILQKKQYRTILPKTATSMAPAKPVTKPVYTLIFS